MTLQEIQNESGPLWLEIQSAITAALEQGRGELKEGITAIEAELKKTKEDAIAAVEKSAAAHAEEVAKFTAALDAANASAAAEKAKLEDEIDALKLSIQVAEESLADHEKLEAECIAAAKTHLEGLFAVLAKAAAPVLSRAEKARLEKLAQLEAQRKALEAEAAQLNG
jgi:predicted component of viral defense system (DUF524 family)